MVRNYYDVIKDISSKLSSLKEIRYGPMEFTFPYMRITHVRETGVNTVIAKITVGITKRPAKVPGITGLILSTAKKYWDTVIISALYSEITNTSKATIILEFKQDIRKIYSPRQIREIILLLEDLYLRFGKLHKSRRETDVFNMPTDFVETEYEPIKKSRTVIVANLISSIFLDEKTVGKIERHDLARKFNKETLEIAFVRRIEWIE